MTKQWDLSGKNKEQAWEEVIARFEAMAPGEEVELLADFDLRQLLSPLQEEKWGLFNWYPLEEGENHWRVVLTRLQVPAQPRGIEEMFTADHRRCDDLFIQLEEAAQAGDASQMAICFSVFEQGMLHHFAMEEKGFFPAFEEATGMIQGPTKVMCMEHQQMRGLLAQMKAMVKKGACDEISRSTSTLMVVMRQHNIKEEQMLYRMADMHLVADRDRLLKQVQAM